jgi:hypothetical protein
VSAAADQFWIWRDLELRVPADWEMLQFSCRRDHGRCAFADRYRFRLELSWQEVAGPPDYERMFSDYRARLEEQGMEDCRTVSRAGWQGLSGVTDGLRSCRYGRFLPAQKVLVEAVFLSEDASDPDQEQRVLRSLKEHRSPSDPVQRWRAFGLDVRVPSDLTLARCRVEPAHAVMSFQNARGRDMVEAARRGLVPEWLKAPVDRWLAADVSERVRNRKQSSEMRQGHSVFLLRGVWWSRFLFSRPRAYEAAAWICPHDGRLYSMRRFPRRRRGSGRGPSEVCHLGCCSQMEAGT